jgi:hypothetical protein
MIVAAKITNWSFFAIIGAAFIVSYIPIINIPFTWITTFFHEVSHGLTAILTGGSVDKIHLHLNGSGLCSTQGGNSFLVAFSGYTGAVLWGVLLFSMVDLLNHKSTNIVAMFLAAMIGIIALVWGRDILTWIILGVMLALFVSIVKLQDTRIVKSALKFIGIFVLLDAIKAPLHLIDGRHYGDGARLADLTGIPELIWVLVWLVFGLLGAFFLWKKNKEKINNNDLT